MNVDPVNEFQCRTYYGVLYIESMIHHQLQYNVYVKLIVGRMVNGWISQEHDESWSINGDGGPKINNNLPWSTTENKCY